MAAANPNNPFNVDAATLNAKVPSCIRRPCFRMLVSFEEERRPPSFRTIREDLWQYAGVNVERDVMFFEIM